jgi:hypothetical protein
MGSTGFRGYILPDIGRPIFSTKKKKKRLFNLILTQLMVQ